MDEGLERVVFRIVAEQLGVEESALRLDTRFDELGADSLDVVEMTIALEDHFESSINDEVIGRVVTIGDVIRLLGGEGGAGTLAKLKPRPPEDSGHAA